ncbi:RNase adapter RapZ, partial [Bacillus sp. B-TM1]
MQVDANVSFLYSELQACYLSHLLAPTGLPLKGIEMERSLLTDMKARANIVLDTSDLKPKELREKIVHLFSTETEQAFRVNVMSFGFKYGIPIDADLVFDVRFLPNPYYI